MVGVIAIVLIIFWFYKTSEQLELPQLPWILGGVTIYYAGFSFWMYIVMRSLMGPKFQNHNLWIGLAMDISSVIAGALLASLFRSRIMAKAKRGD